MCGWIAWMAVGCGPSEAEIIDALEAREQTLQIEWLTRDSRVFGNPDDGIRRYRLTIRGEARSDAPLYDRMSDAEIRDACGLDAGASLGFGAVRLRVEIPADVTFPFEATAASYPEPEAPDTWRFSAYRFDRFTPEGDRTFARVRASFGEETVIDGTPEFEAHCEALAARQ